MRNMVLRVCLLTSGIGFLPGCPSSFQGEYRDPTEVEIIDEYWNETDARKTAEVMINGLLKKPWLAYYQERNKSRPVVIVDMIENRTDEHIDTKALTESIQNELINSGRVRFVNKGRRDAILKEIKYQQDSGMVSKDSAKKKGKQTGADYMLSGSISSHHHTKGDVKTRTYQTNLTLTNLETAEIEWSDKHAIKKRFERSGTSW